MIASWTHNTPGLPDPLLESLSLHCAFYELCLSRLPFLFEGVIWHLCWVLLFLFYSSWCLTRCQRNDGLDSRLTFFYLIFLAFVSWVTISFLSNDISDIQQYAVAVKSLQLCPTLCGCLYSCPPGSSVHRILQARIMEWVAISFSIQQYSYYCFRKII